MAVQRVPFFVIHKGYIAVGALEYIPASPALQHGSISATIQKEDSLFPGPERFL